MVKNIISPSGGVDISSGTLGADSILSLSLTETVNKGKDIDPGESNAAMVDATIWGHNLDDLSESVDLFSLTRTDGNLMQKHPGYFEAKTLDRPSKATVKVIAYSPLSALDKDLTKWIDGLDAWPYPLKDFVQMVCNACNLGYALADIPNGDFPVYKISRTKTTGRQLIKWIGEICCRFLVMESVAAFLPTVKLSWYTDSGVTLYPTGKDYYYSGGQSQKDVPEIESAHVLYRTKEDDYFFPSIADARDHQYYTINGNALIEALPKDEDGYILDEDSLQGYLDVIKQEFTGLSYTPCKLSCPARLDIRPGHIFYFVGSDGKTHKALCMKKITKGQKDTIECTGNPLRTQYHK